MTVQNRQLYSTTKEGNVTFTKDSAEPDGYQPEDKFATVHYTVSVEGSSIEGLSNKSVPAARFGSTGTFVKKKVAKVHKIMRAVWQWLMMKRG